MLHSPGLCRLGQPEWWWCRTVFSHALSFLSARADVAVSRVAFVAKSLRCPCSVLEAGRRAEGHQRDAAQEPALVTDCSFCCSVSAFFLSLWAWRSVDPVKGGCAGRRCAGATELSFAPGPCACIRRALVTSGIRIRRWLCAVAACAGGSALAWPGQAEGQRGRYCQAGGEAAAGASLLLGFGSAGYGLALRAQSRRLPVRCRGCSTLPGLLSDPFLALQLADTCVARLCAVLRWRWCVAGAWLVLLGGG